MAYITWDPAHETGIPGIDYEHRRLVELLNDIHDLIAARAEPLRIADRLADLYTLATAHFALEEKVMQEQKYPGLAARRDLHYRLLEQVREIMDAYETGSYRSGDMLPATLKHWLSDAMAGDAELFAGLGDIKLRHWGLRRA